MKVIIVDDSKLLRDRIRELISDIQGVDIVGEAENSFEAIDLIKNLKPDLMTLDIRMPGSSGLEVLEEMKKLNSKTITIVMTNYPQPQDRNECLELGADYFFDKSLEYDRVREVVSGIQSGHIRSRSVS